MGKELETAKKRRGEAFRTWLDADRARDKANRARDKAYRAWCETDLEVKQLEAEATNQTEGER